MKPYCKELMKLSCVTLFIPYYLKTEVYFGCGCPIWDTAFESSFKCSCYIFWLHLWINKNVTGCVINRHIILYIVYQYTAISIYHVLRLHRYCTAG